MSICDLRIDNVVKSYDGKNAVLRSLSMDVKAGERVAILGPSGCGKTTLLNVLCGLAMCDSGRIFLGDRDVTRVSPGKRNIVVVSQENLLFPHMNVFENIAFGLRARRKDEKLIQDRVGMLLDEIGLSGRGASHVAELSGGQKQRVALARALAVNPEVLLLDEAFSSLDANLRGRMRSLVISLQKKHGFTMILVTHDREEAMLFSDRIAVLLDGKMEQYCTPCELYEKPVNLKTARFLLEKNYIVRGDETLLVRPEDFSISGYADGGMMGTVLHAAFSGVKRIYRVLLDGDAEVEVHDYRREDVFSPGDICYLNIVAASVFDEEGNRKDACSV